MSTGAEKTTSPETKPVAPPSLPVVKEEESLAAKNTVAESVADAVASKVVPRGGGLNALGREFIKSYVKDLVDDHEENPLLTLVPALMEWIEKNGNGQLSGPEKKKLVMNLLF